MFGSARDAYNKIRGTGTGNAPTTGMGRGFSAALGAVGGIPAFMQRMMQSGAFEKFGGPPGLMRNQLGAGQPMPQAPQPMPQMPQMMPQFQNGNPQIPMQMPPGMLGAQMMGGNPQIPQMPQMPMQAMRGGVPQIGQMPQMAQGPQMAQMPGGGTFAAMLGGRNQAATDAPGMGMFSQMLQQRQTPRMFSR